jgi:hypothetical protein
VSTLCIDYGYESSFRRSIKTAKSELNKRVDDYENIANRARSIPSSTSNTSNCAYYAKKKYQQIQGKIDKLSTLDRQVDAFVEHVKEADKRVASRIKKDTKSFKKRTGIGKNSKSLWASICEGIGDFFTWVGGEASEVWNNVKQWYEDNKYWINIVVDVVLVVAAVAACIGTGGLALAVNIFFVVDSVCDLIYDGAAAYQYYVEGNEAEAERLSGKGGKDAFMWIGRQADNLFGTDFLEGTMGVIHTGLSICAIGYSFYKTGKQILKDLKLDKIKVKSLFNGNRNKIKWGSHFNKQNITKAARNYFGFKSAQQKDVMKLRWKKILGFKLGEKLIKTPARAKQLIQIKYLYKGGKKVYKTVSKFYKNFTEGNYNPFSKTAKSVTEFLDGIKAIPSGGVA